MNAEARRKVAILTEIGYHLLSRWARRRYGIRYTCPDERRLYYRVEKKKRLVRVVELAEDGKAEYLPTIPL